MKFKSELFSGDVMKMTSDLSKVTSFWNFRRDKMKQVRSFVNGLAIAADKPEDGESTNYLTGYAAVMDRIGILLGTYNQTRRFCNVVVTTGDEEGDSVAAAIIEEAFNEEILYGSLSGRGVYNFIYKLAGELQITGGIPLVFSDHALIPMDSGLLLPEDTPIDLEGFTRAYQPKVLSYQELETLGNSESGMVNTSAIKAILKEWEAKNKETGFHATGREHIKDRSIDTSSTDYLPNQVESPGLPVWWFYEATKNGKIAGTMFAKTVNGESVSVLVYDEDYAESVGEFIMFFNINTEIGGEQTVGSTRGIAEVTYNSGTMMEIILGTIVDGDLDRSRQRYQLKDGVEVDEDAILQWSTSRSSIVPAALQQFRESSSSAGMSGVFSLLNSNISGITQTGQGGQDDLRVQALARDRRNQASMSQMAAQWAVNMEALCTMMLFRAFTMKLTPTTPGGNAVRRFRKKVELAGLDLKMISKVEFGGFKYLRCHVGHTSDSQATVEWLTANIGSLPPQTRPIAMKMLLSKVTGNPRLADTLFGQAQVISNTQKGIAQNESQTIMLRALMGQRAPVNASDIHEDHIPEHTRDAVSIILKNDYVPWTEMEVRMFDALTEHIREHIGIMKGNPATQALGNQFMAELDALVAAGENIAALIKEQQEDGEGLSFEQKLAMRKQEVAEKKLESDVALKGMAVGLAAKKEASLVESRNRRAASQDSAKTVVNAAMAANLVLKAEKQKAELEAMAAERSIPGVPQQLDLNEI